MNSTEKLSENAKNRSVEAPRKNKKKPKSRPKKKGSISKEDSTMEKKSTSQNEKKSGNEKQSKMVKLEKKPSIELKQKTDKMQTTDDPEKMKLDEQNVLLGGLKQAKYAKWKAFVENIQKIVETSSLEDYYVRNLLNMAPPNPTFEAFSKNPFNNRSSDIFCLDSTRVKLKDPDNSNDYIHANFISIERARVKYIATQHPLASTISDFWQMVYNEEVRWIITFKNTTDSEFPDFFPIKENATLEFGKYKITCKKKADARKSTATGYLCRLNKITKPGEEKKVLISHYPYWGKSMIPESPKMLQKLLDRMQSTENFAPAVVQCETGVNQSSVIIFVEALWSRLDRNYSLDIASIFQEMRSQRFYMMPQRLHFVYSIYIVMDRIRRESKEQKVMPEVVQMINELEAKIVPSFKNQYSPEPTDLEASD